MNRTNLKAILCASALAFVASAVSAQDQQFTPANGAATPLTTDATGSIMVKVDGSRVVSATGQPLGRIENIVLSPVGCAEAAILTGSSGRLVPIPWTLVRVSGDTRVAGAVPGANLVFTVNADPVRIAQAPSFTRSQWPDMSNPAWLQASTSFFGGASAVGAAGAGTNVITGGAASGVGAAGGATNVITGGATNSTSVAPLPPSTATGGTQQDRIGSTATQVPTNSSILLPPTGRTNSARPPGLEPRPLPPQQTPGIPPGPPAGTPPPTRPPGSVPPPSQP